MTTDTLIEFDETRALRYDPNRVLKYARIRSKTPDEETTIVPEWGGTQTFVGSYFEIFNPDSGMVLYGSGYEEWMNTNRPWPNIANGWYKSSPVDAYQSDTEGVLVTILKSGVKETEKHVNIGDWLVRQQDGEVMCVSADKFPTLYDLASARPL